MQKEGEGRPGGSVGSASNFSSGHDLAARGFEPRVGLYADSSEPRAASDSVSPSLSAPPLIVLSVSLSKINIKKLKKKKRITN